MEFFNIIQNALEILLKNLKPFIEDSLINLYGNEYLFYMEHGIKAYSDISINNINSMKDYNLNLELSNNKKYRDVLFYINALIKNWDGIKNLFKTNYILCLSHDIKFFRHKWAHQSNFTTRELYRFVDQCQAFIEEFGGEVYEIEILRKAVLEYLYNEEVNKALINSGICNTGNVGGNNMVNSCLNISSVNYQGFFDNNNSNLYSSLNTGNYSGNNTTCSNLKTYNNIYSQNNNYIDNEDMVMANLEDFNNVTNCNKDEIHTLNFNKMITNINSQDQYKITYYEDGDAEGDTHS